jgi:hypothetical protein
MALHKYKVGQVVQFAPGRSSMQAWSSKYTIVKLLPPENGQNLYRIKGASEVFERMAKETDLSRD